MAFHVEVTREAQAETDEAFVWCSENWPFEGAVEWYNGLLEAFWSLQEMPLRCGLALENAYFEEEVRQLLYLRHYLGRDATSIVFCLR